MTSMTADAQQLFDHYIRTVRWSLRGIEGAEDIERDVREHVDSALQEQEEPASSHTLRQVLARLGDPWQWVPLDEVPWWRRIAMRFSLGPEDWRLAYLCFGLTILGLVTLPIGVGVFILIGAYIIARATVALAADRDQPLGPRRWLVYPPLVAAAFFVAIALIAGPAAPLAGWAIDQSFFPKVFDRVMPKPALDAFATLLTFGAWWIVLSGIVAIAMPAVRAIFAPFGTKWRRVHALWLTALGVVSAGIGAAFLLL